MGTSTITDVEIATEHEGRVVAVIGSRRNHNQPYLWIGSDDAFYASLDVRAMRKLRDAIDDALASR